MQIYSTLLATGLIVPHIHIAPINNISGPFPVLRKLVIFVLDWDMNQPPFAPLHNAPNLHDLRLVTPLVSPARIGAASVHLTFLEIYSRVTLAECLDILSQFPNLLHLSVLQVRPTEQDRVSCQYHLFPPLHSLCLKPFTSLLAFISLPRLRRLTVDVYDVPAADDLVGFLSISSPKITYLDITFRRYYVGRDPFSVCAAVGSRDSTLIVRMRRRPVQLRIDYRLLHQEDGFPALRTLHVHQAVSLDIASEPLLAILDSRLASKLSIVTLTLEHLYRIDKSVVESGPDPQLLGL
ncbi:hypothetical protein C8J57DRAFT_1512744 [Mycena rebaudengoi]|nr:hypothetical protein C8J57DRAFT_1512744 [Mycena rebaudengoi]